jgi:hypothetical protein
MKGLGTSLLLALLVNGCATVPPTTSSLSLDPALLQRPLDKAACEAAARADESSVVFRAALGQGALGTGLLILYGAAEGAAWGAITGGSRADGAWIGAAVGASLGLVVGIVNGVEAARAVRSRYLEAFRRCLSESQPPSQSPSSQEEPRGAPPVLCPMPAMISSTIGSIDIGNEATENRVACLLRGNWVTVATCCDSSVGHSAWTAMTQRVPRTASEPCRADSMSMRPGSASAPLC